MKTKKFVLAIIIVLLGIGNVKANNSEEQQKVYIRVLLFTWQDSLSVDTKAEFLDLFKGLPEKVDGFIGCSVNDIEWSKDGYQTVLVLKLTGNDAVKAYEEHDDHKKILEIGPTIVKDFSMYNYWEE